MKARIAARVSVAAVLVALAACSASPECSGASCAPTNPHGVPAVVGMPLSSACRTLKANMYWGGIRKVLRGEPQGKVVQQDPNTQTVAYLGQVVMLTVTEPVDVKNLPAGCVSRLPGY